MGVGLSCNLHKKPKAKDCQKTGIVTCRQMYPGVRTTCEKGCNLQVVVSLRILWTKGHFFASKLQQFVITREGETI